MEGMQLVVVLTVMMMSVHVYSVNNRLTFMFTVCTPVKWSSNRS